MPGTDAVNRSGIHRSPLRLILMVAAGLAVALTVGLTGSWPFAPVAGWAGACVLYVLWVWLAIWRMGPERTAAHATREDPVRPVADLLLLIASVAGLVALGVLLVAARSTHGGQQIGAAALAVVGVGTSWLLVHTLYALRYARIYYSASPPGGISFNQKTAPRYSDFAYVAFTVGMTFQVADTNVGDSVIRATMLRHMLLSYLFGSGILAAVVNLIAGLSG